MFFLLAYAREFKKQFFFELRVSYLEKSESSSFSEVGYAALGELRVSIEGAVFKTK